MELATENMHVIVRVRPTLDDLNDVCMELPHLSKLTLIPPVKMDFQPMTPSTPRRAASAASSAPSTPRGRAGSETERSAPMTPRTPRGTARNNEAPKDYMFDRVYGPESGQEQLFESSVAGLVKSAFEGHNVTVFAYGATGSGKTFTITGSTGSLQNQGVIPRTFHRLFDLVHSNPHASSSLYSVRMSYVELYNDEFRDLLNPDNTPEAAKKIGWKRAKLEMHDDKRRGVFLSGSDTLYQPIKSAKEALHLLQKGEKIRSFGMTNYNEHSSRSHALLTVYIDKQQIVAGQSSVVSCGKIHLIDLAGSERLDTSANAELQRETLHINSSLTALGNVLSALAKRAKSDDNSILVPYRDNKLTHFLKDSIGGRSKTLMIANVHSTSEHYRDILMTLMYASRARSIKSTPAVNYDASGKSKLAAVTQELMQLKSALDARTREFEQLRLQSSQSAEENDRLKAKMQQLSEQNKSEQHQLDQAMQDLVFEQNGRIVEQKYQYVHLQEELSSYRIQLQSIIRLRKLEKENVEIMEKQLQMLKAEKNLLASQRDQAVQQLSGLLEQMQVQEASHNDLRQNYEHLLAKHTENDKDLSEATAHLQAQNMSLQNEVQSLLQAQAEVDSKVEQEQAINRKMERRVNKLESVVQEQDQTVAGLREQIQELQSENEQLRAQSSVDKKRNQDHDTKRVAKVEAELAEALNRNSALEKKLEALQKKLSQTAAEVDEKSQRAKKRQASALQEVQSALAVCDEVDIDLTNGQTQLADASMEVEQNENEPEVSEPVVSAKGKRTKSVTATKRRKTKSASVAEDDQAAVAAMEDSKIIEDTVEPPTQTPSRSRRAKAADTGAAAKKKSESTSAPLFAPLNDVSVAVLAERNQSSVDLNSSADASIFKHGAAVGADVKITSPLAALYSPARRPAGRDAPTGAGASKNAAQKKRRLFSALTSASFDEDEESAAATYGGGAKPQRNEPSADAPARDLFAQFMKGNSMQLKIPKLKASVPSSGRA